MLNAIHLAIVVYAHIACAVVFTHLSSRFDVDVHVFDRNCIGMFRVGAHEGQSQMPRVAAAMLLLLAFTVSVAAGGSLPTPSQCTLPRPGAIFFCFNLLYSIAHRIKSSKKHWLPACMRVIPNRVEHRIKVGVVPSAWTVCSE